MNKIVMRKAITLSPDNALIAKAFGIIALFVALFAFTLPSEGRGIPNPQSKDTSLQAPTPKEKPVVVIVKLLEPTGRELKIENNSTFISNPPSATPVNENNGGHSEYASIQSENFANSPWMVWILLMTAGLALMIGLIIGLLYKMRNNTSNGPGEIEHYGTVQHEHHRHYTHQVIFKDKKEHPSPH